MDVIKKILEKHGEFNEKYLKALTFDDYCQYTFGISIFFLMLVINLLHKYLDKIIILRSCCMFGKIIHVNLRLLKK